MIKRDILITCISFAISMILLFSGLAVCAYFEAKSYKKFCDKPVTTWDAMWLSLKIDECGRSK